MRELTYYPGCTHRETARHLGESALVVTEQLGYRLKEMPDWECCGTVHGLCGDDLIHQVAPVRNLARVEAAGYDRVCTLCAMCYNTLSQANMMVRGNREGLDALNLFMDEEPDYHGGVEVVHLLQLLREIGMGEIRSRVKRPLSGLRVMPYYGCLLLRPKQVAIDTIERPTLMQEILKSMGAEAVADPRSTQCCGSYHTVTRREVVETRVREIVGSARRRGADAIALSCPLCEFNLDVRQEGEMPVLYLTQLLALSMEREEACHFELHRVDPRPLLRSRGLLG